MNRPIITIALAMSCMSAVSAEGQPRLPSSMAACADITDAAQRAQCYDREVAILRGKENAPAASPPATRPAVAVPAAAPAPAPADFGAESMTPGSRTEDQGPTLEARITRLQEQQPGVYIVTLDNGQVWRQPERRLAFELKAGDVVKIRKASMGAYRLWLDARGSNQWVRVVRVK